MRQRLTAGILTVAFLFLTMAPAGAQAQEQEPPEIVFAEESAPGDVLSEGSVDSALAADQTDDPEIPVVSFFEESSETGLFSSGDAATLADQADDTEIPIISFSEESPETELFLSDEELSVKKEVAEHGVSETLSTLTAGEDYVDSQVIFYAETRERAEAVAEAYGGELVNYAYGIATISLRDADLDVIQAVRLGEDLSVSLPAVEPNYLIREEEPVAEGNDPLAEAAEDPEEENATDLFDSAVTRRQSWADFYQGLTNPDPALHPENEHYQWGHDMVDSWDAWDVTKGSSDITVAVIDTGVLADHEELAGRVTVHEVSTVQEDKTVLPLGTTPKGEHATHVAGIIAAAADNGVGGSGVAPEVKILSICVQMLYSEKDPYLEKYGEEEWVVREGMPYDAIAEAIRYVAGYNEDNTRDPGGKRAQIINMSLGGASYSAVLKQAVDTAYREGVTILSTTGNDQANCLKYPACFEHVISVSCVDPSGGKAGFSSFGKQADISAPGTDIWSSSVNMEVKPLNTGKVTVTVKGDKDYYEYMSGTSMACPMVAGACALYMSVAGETDPDTMAKLLKKHVTKSSSKQIGTGILDVGGLICQAAGKTTPAPAPVTGLVTAIEVSGQRYIAPGKSAAFTATSILPKNAKNKKLVWSLAPEGKGATIDVNKGTVKVAADAAAGGEAFTVTATAADGGGASGQAVFYIREDKATAVVINTAQTDAFFKITRNSKARNTVTGAQLFNADVAVSSAPARDEHRLTLSAQLFAGDRQITDAAVAPLWISSNPALVAIEDADSDGRKTASSVTLRALGTKAGKATITCLAQDGSKKKATMKITVKVPASNLTLTTKNSQQQIAIGKSAQVKAVLGNTYGKPTTNKIKWSYEVGFKYWDGESDEMVFEAQSDLHGWVSLSQSGVVKVSSKVNPFEVSYGDVCVRVTAETTDGSEWRASGDYQLTVQPVQLNVLDPDSNAVTKTVTLQPGRSTTYAVQAASRYKISRSWYHQLEWTPYELTVTSNKPEIAGGFYTWNSDQRRYLLCIYAGQKTGTATLTLQTNDGSGKKTTFKVTVQ